MATLPNYLTVTEIANALGVNRSLVNYWIAQGKLKAFRAGPVWLVHEDHFAAFQRRRPPQLGKKTSPPKKP